MLEIDDTHTYSKIIRILDFWGIECSDEKLDLDLNNFGEKKEPLKSLWTLENKKNAYKKTLLEKHSENYYIQVEKNNIAKNFNALKLENDDFVHLNLSTNPLLKVYRSNFAFYFNGDSMTNYEKRDVEYIFLPKYISFGEFVVDDILLNGPLSKIKNLIKYQYSFTIHELTQETEDQNKISGIVSLIKFLLLNQFIVIV